MSVRKLIFVLAGVLVVVLAATFLIARSLNGPTEASRPTIAPNAVPYAYITERQFVLRRGGQTIAQVPRIFDAADALKNTVVWTPSGDYVAFLSDENLRQDDVAKTQLISVDARTGEVRRSPCPYCSDLVATGTNTVIADRGLFLLSFDVDTGKEPTMIGHKLQNTVLFLAGSKNRIYTQQYQAMGAANAIQIRFIDPKTWTTTTPMLPISSNEYAPVAATNGDPGTLAVAADQGSGTCVARFPILVTDNDGVQTGTDLSAAYPSGSDDNPVEEGIQVTDLWWDAKGGLHASISSWKCDESKSEEFSKRQYVSPSVLWRLDGKKWVKEDSTPALKLRPLDGAKRVALTCATGMYCQLKDVYELDGPTRTKIADGVVSLSTPPKA